jgi:hypothetical protein
MSLFDGDTLARPGQLSCICDGDITAPEDRPWRQQGTAALAAGFALAVLAQALAIGMLPLAGRQVAPSPELVGLPFAAMLLGAVAASLPASILLDRFGRRAAFALGAGLGIAGGLIIAFALVERQFVPLCLGAFWLGISQGFGLFYRHVGAMGGSSSATAWIFGAGALAGLVGPWIATSAEALTAPYFLVGTAFATSAVQVAALALAVTLPAPPVHTRPLAQADATPVSTLVTVLAFAAPAWGLMSATMAYAPLAMIDCGISAAGVTGVVSWHLLAMYAPALAVPALARWIGLKRLMTLSVLLAIAGTLALHSAATTKLAIAAAMALVGAAWALTSAASTLYLHRFGRASALILGIHDVACLLAALAGTFIATAFWAV